MPIDSNSISRNNATGLIPEPVAREIIQGAVEKSAVLSMGTRLPNMTAKQLTMPVLDNLPMAYFVNGSDEGTKKLTQMAWGKKKIIAEEIAVIVPIPEAVLDDADYDIWGEVRPRLVEAFGRVIDGAVVFGVNKPETWRESLLDTCVASNSVVVRTSDVYTDIFGEGGALSLVEDSGYDPDGIMAAVKMKAMLRGLKDLDGQPIFKTDLQDTTRYSLEGIRMEFPKNGSFDADAAHMILGDFKQLVYAIRSDIEFKLFTEGVVQDPQSKEILYNLMQNDMVALRATMRLGWEIPNPINAFNADNATRCPFAAYVPNTLNLGINFTDITAATDLYGKYVTDLQDNVELEGNTIYGDVKYVTGYTGFSGDASEQRGNYLAFSVTAATGATVKSRLTGAKNTGWATHGVVGDGGYDPIAVFMLGQNKPYYDQVIEIQATKDGKTATRRFYLSQLNVENA